MPPRRLQVSSGINPPSLRPVASPTDTFVQTAEGAQLDQLARGLAQVSPSLGRFSDTLAEKQSQADAAAGEAKRRELGGKIKDELDAVKKGLIGPHESSWFMAGFHEQSGRISADNMNFYVQSKLAADEQVQTATDPTDFTAAYDKYRKEWVSQNLEGTTQDQYFEKGFGSRSDAAAASAQNDFVNGLGSRVMRFAGQAHFAEVYNSVRTELDRGMSHAAIAAELTALNDVAVKKLNGDLVNQKTVDAVVAAAKEANDTSILDILKSIGSGPKLQSGSRAGLGSTQYGLDQVEAASKEIATENQSRASREWSAAEHKKTDDEEKIYQAVFSKLEAAPDAHSVDLSDERKAMTLVAPEKVPLLLEFQKQFSEKEQDDSPQQAADALRRVYIAHPGEHLTTLEDAAALVANRQISKGTWREIVSDIHERDTNGNKFERDPSLKEGKRQLRSMFVSELGLLDTPMMRQKAAEAEDEFTARYIAWRSGPGKEADSAKTLEWMNTTRAAVFTSKSGSIEIRDFSKIPKASLGPVVPDPAKHLVTDPTNINNLLNELRQFQDHKRTSLSPQAISVLQYVGIPANLKAIQEFVDQQMKLLPTAILPDSTGN